MPYKFAINSFMTFEVIQTERVLLRLKGSLKATK